jgi:hypothetical protein
MINIFHSLKVKFKFIKYAFKWFGYGGIHQVIEAAMLNVMKSNVSFLTFFKIQGQKYT